MRLVFALVACLLLPACSASMANKSIDNAFDWSALVKPQDAVPTECTRQPKALPAITDGSKTAKEAAREYRKLELATRDLQRAYKRCRIWAQGQR